MRTRHHFAHLLVLVATFMALVVAIAPVQAAAPAISIEPQWRPRLVLAGEDSNGDTIYPNDDGDDNFEPGGDDDDVTYAELWIYVNASVPFWATQMTCTYDGARLRSFDPDYDFEAGYPNTDDWNDDWNMVDPSGHWYQGEGATAIQPSDHPNWNPNNGSMTFTIARQGVRSEPLGGNGVFQRFLLARVRFQVKPLTTATNVAINCTGVFLDRNGAPVVTPTYVAPEPLRVIPGYTLAGKVTYQNRTDHSGIGVACRPNSQPNDDTDGDGVPDSAYKTVTNTQGMWQITTRQRDYYSCAFYGNTYDADANATDPNDTPDAYIRIQADIPLYGGSNRFLPTELPLGNVAMNDHDRVDEINNFPWGEEEIGMGDINVITGNWNQPNTDFDTGDVNGDGATNRHDLAIVAANMNWSEGWSPNHLLYGLRRTGTNSKIWLGTADTGFVTPYIAPPAGAQDFWPMLSPDGSKIAFIRAMNVSGQRRYILYSVNWNGTTGLTRLSPDPASWNFDAFAPSWSEDSSQIAFVCSKRNEFGAGQHGYSRDKGYLCLVDSRGGNFQIVERVYGEDASARIFTPSWMGNDSVLFGGYDSNGICGSRICYYSFWEGHLVNQWHVDEVDNIVRADMPTRNQGDQIFYRATLDDGSRILMYAELQWNWDSYNEWHQYIPAFDWHDDDSAYGVVNTTDKPEHVHTVTTYEDPDDPGNWYRVTQNLEYIDSWGDAAIIYERNPWTGVGGTYFIREYIANGVWGGGNYQGNWNAFGEFPEFDPPWNVNAVFNQVGNLTYPEGTTPPERYFAERVAFDWTR